MNFQSYTVEATKVAAGEAFKYAKAVPADRLEWAPEGARSVLSICRELAWTPEWAESTLAGKEIDMSEAAWAEMKKVEADWKSVDDCIAQFDKRMTSLEKAMLSFPDEKLSDKRWLPYDGGRDFTFKEMFEYARWNSTYHLGQIAYIQTLYGDKEMH